MKTVVEQTEKEVLTTSQRWVELLIVVPMLLLFSFFAYHQGANTGFFTAKFGAVEMFCLCWREIDVAHLAAFISWL